MRMMIVMRRVEVKMNDAGGWSDEEDDDEGSNALVLPSMFFQHF